MKFDRSLSDKISRELLGKEFEKAARGPEKYDCMGILIYYFSRFNIEIPDYSNITDWGEYDAEYVSAIAKVVRRLGEDEKPEIGDIAIFRNLRDVTGTLNHAGVYLGKGKFLHSGMKFGTKIDSLYVEPWKSHVYGYFRIREADKRNS